MVVIDDVVPEKTVIPLELTPNEKLSVVIKAMKAKGGMSKFVKALQECQAGLAQEELVSLGKQSDTEKALLKLQNRVASDKATREAGQSWRDSNDQLAAQKWRGTELKESRNIWKSARAGIAPEAISKSK